jgi:hypothetical protein
MRKYVSLVRKLHHYFGLFISPLVLVYSLSALSFNHPGLANRLDPVRQLPEIKTMLNSMPYEPSDLETAENICRMLNINGEMDTIYELFTQNAGSAE